MNVTDAIDNAVLKFTCSKEWEFFLSGLQINYCLILFFNYTPWGFEKNIPTRHFSFPVYALEQNNENNFNKFSLMII